MKLPNKHVVGLTTTQERELSRRWQIGGDLQARNQMVLANLGLVMSEADKSYKRDQRVPFDDLFIEGCLGLIRACDKYDSSIGKFSTYANHWIRSGLRQIKCDNAGPFRLSANKTFQIIWDHMGEVVRKLHALGQVVTVEAIAERVGRSPEQVLMALYHISESHRSRDEQFGLKYGDDDPRTLDDTRPELADHNTPEEEIAKRQEHEIRSWCLKKALHKLDPRLRVVIEKRLLSENPKTLAELGEILGISRERARQLELEALGLLRGEVKRCERRLKESRASLSKSKSLAL